MKITQNQLPNYLNTHINQANKISGFYWLNSEDGFLLIEAVKKIRKLLNQNNIDTSDRVLYHIDTSTDWQEITNALQTPSLFSTHSVIELHFINKITLEQQQKLVALTNIQNPNVPSTIIVVYPFRMDAKALKAKWISHLDNHGVIITIWPPSNTEYPSWLKAECQKYKISFSNPECFNYLCQKTMGNPGAAAQTLYKLKLQNVAQASLELLQQVLSEHANYDIFDLTDAYLQGNTKLCFTILKVLQQNDTAVLLILWALRKDLQILGEVFEQSYANKQRPAQILNTFPGLWVTKKNSLNQALGVFNLDSIYKSLHHIAIIEYTVKTANNDLLVWQQLEQLILIAKNLLAPLTDMHYD